MDDNYNRIVAFLKEKRQEIASLKKVEVFKVLQNKTIEEIARLKPQTVEELAKIKGIGESKLVNYGQWILQIVRDKRDVISDKPEKSQPSLLEASREENTSKSTETLSVSEFLSHLNNILTTQEYDVVGEISELKAAAYSVYFSLKDKKDGAVVNCYMSRWKYDALGMPITEGMEVKVAGYPEIYKPSGRLSLVANNIELVGEGALRKAYELLKKKLEAEGLFARKRELPEFIERIGVISSKNGVVIQDFRKNLNNRGFQIYFYDARMEGAEAPRTIIQGIKAMNRLKPDLIVIMRGGGSLESMQAFNSENVVRAIFASDIPVLCGIGHDVDVPIASLVADRYASTPTATAHVVNQSWKRLEEGIPILCHRLVSKFEIVLRNNLSLTESFFERIGSYIEDLSGRILQAGESMVDCFTEMLEKFRQKLDHGEKILAAFNPENQLKLGYSIVFDNAGKVVKNVDSLKIGDMIRVRMEKGSVDTEVKKVNS